MNQRLVRPVLGSYLDGGEVDFWAKLPPTRRKAGREVFTQTMDGGAGVIPGATDTQLL